MDRRLRALWARCIGGTPARRRTARPIQAGLRMEVLEARTVPTQLLIATWNVDMADTNGANKDPVAYQTVLAAMGQEDLYATPQPPDILTASEVRSNSNSGSTADTQWITDQMNAVYGGGYSHGTLNANSSGGGTEGVVYNANTVSLLEEKAVGTVSSNGPPRQEYRYLFRPVGYSDGSADFYVYVGHYKSGYTTTDQSRRNVEAQEVRADADALGFGRHILYTGDFNTDGSDEPAQQTLLAPGNGQAFDPISRLGHWYNSSAFVDIDTIGSTNLDDRFDLLWETAGVHGRPGLVAIPSTYHTFGVDGSVPLHQAVDYAGNTALPDLPNRLDVLHDLARICSDHVPVLQDYQILPHPSAPLSGSDGVAADLVRAMAASPSVPTTPIDAGAQAAAPDTTPSVAALPRGDWAIAPDQVGPDRVTDSVTAGNPSQAGVDGNAPFQQDADVGNW